MDINKITVCVCNYNTTELTNKCISSFLATNDKNLYTIKVLDNSDCEKYIKFNSTIKVIDNTKELFLNFDNIFKLSPYLLMKTNGNNFGSLKHAISILFLLNSCTTDKMILFDSDIIVNKTLDFIDDNENITIADLLKHNTYAYEDNLRKNILYTSKTRFLPYILYFNISLMKKYNIHYFDFSRIHGIISPNNGYQYDTGASLYEDCISNNIKFRQIDYHDYVIHLGQGSWKKAFNDTYLKNEQND